MIRPPPIGGRPCLFPNWIGGAGQSKRTVPSPSRIPDLIDDFLPGTLHTLKTRKRVQDRHQQFPQGGSPLSQ